MDEITLDSLCGEHLFSGVEMTTETFDDVYWGERDRNVCLFTLDGITYKAVENPDDGYRSYCSYIDISRQKPMYQFPPIKVVCHKMESSEYGTNDILVVRDVLNGKIVLEIGTCHTDDYYPCCHFNYMPENMACNEGKCEENNNGN